MDMADITKAGSLMVKTSNDGTETWIFPITSTDNVTHHDTEQLDEYLDAMEKSIVKTDATQTQHGLLSTDDKKKLDGIASGANKTTVDSEMSSTSTNPVQNRVIQEALDKKVTAVSGKGLSTNDFTAAYKTKLDALTSLEIVSDLPSSVTIDSSYLLIDGSETE